MKTCKNCGRQIVSTKDVFSMIAWSHMQQPFIACFSFEAEPAEEAKDGEDLFNDRQKTKLMQLVRSL